MKDDKEHVVRLQELEIELKQTQPPPKNRVVLSGCIFGATVIGTLSLISPFVLTRSPLPYMATPGHKIRHALEFVKNKKKTNRFVDLGSGDGEGVYQAVLSGYRIATGIELNRTLYYFSRIRRQFWSANLRRRSNFLKQDFFSYNLTDADTCMIFGVTPLMEPISRKLAKECSSGTHVLSYRFKLPLATEEDPGLLKASIVYDVDEMRVYECD